MAPRRRDQSRGSGGPRQQQEPQERGSKRPRSAAASAAPDAARRAPPPPSSPPVGAVTRTRRAQQHQPHQQQELDEQEQSLQRSLEVLYIVLERQRHAAREARKDARRQYELEEEAPGAESLQGCITLVCHTGADADDGEKGAVTGAGWIPGRGSTPDPFAAYKDPGLTFVETSAAAARVCRAWRRVAFAAADRAVMSVRRAGRRGIEFLSRLKPYEGGVLRALYVNGELDAEKVDAVATARALGLFGEGRASAPLGGGGGGGGGSGGGSGGGTGGSEGGGGGGGGGNSNDGGGGGKSNDGAGVASVLRGLRALHMTRARPLLDALAGLGHLDGLVARVRHAPPPPALFCSLRTLELEKWASMYRSVQPDADCSPPGFFTHSNLPSLRVLKVELSERSNCPLELGCDVAPALAPPALTRLHVTMHGVNRTEAWPPAQPLSVSVRSLAALAPTLVSLWADCAGAVAGPFSSGGHSGGGDGGGGGGGRGGGGDVGDAGPLRPTDWPHSILDTCLQQTGHARPPPEIAPMERLLPGLASLSRLTSLALSPYFDWKPAPVRLAHIDEAHRPRLERARRREWLSACRRALLPFSRTLRRLDLYDWGLAPHEAVVLPPSMSLLTALTSLFVGAKTVASVGRGLRRLTALRSLTLQATFPEFPDDHGPLSADDLWPLVRLEFLSITEVVPCLAAPIENALPRLAKLTLVEDNKPFNEDGARFPGPPPLEVLRAAQRRAERGGTAVFFCTEPGWPSRPVSAAELAEMIAKRLAAGEHFGHGEELHERLHAKAEVEAALYIEDEQWRG